VVGEVKGRQQASRALDPKCGREALTRVVVTNCSGKERPSLEEGAAPPSIAAHVPCL